MEIAGYKINTAFATAGSGNARWCIAEKCNTQYFLKQFLAPVQPVQTTENPTELIARKRQRCASFEHKKRALYQALANIKHPSLVPVSDFFVYDGHYFAVSEFIDPSFPNLTRIHTLPRKTALRLLLSLAECMKELHQCGLVHADLKPEHIIIDNRIGKTMIRLIDFDSGFFENDPPDTQSNIEVDPVYLAPETFRLMTGEPVQIDRRIDIFSLGILLHQAFTGELPKFDRQKYTYLYACILDHGKISVSEKLDRKQKAFILRMLQKNPAKRPDDHQICTFLQKEWNQER